MAPCPVCASNSAPKFDGQSDWCARCTTDYLGVQEAERWAEQKPEVIDPNVNE